MNTYIAHTEESSSSVDLLHPLIQPAMSSTWIKQGSKEYTSAGVALFLMGFASFSLIYCVQPLLPAFTVSFGISPTTSALALSLTTGLLAISIVLSSAFSQSLGRRRLMFVSLFLAAILNMIMSIVPSWHGLLFARAMQGVVLGGVPAVAMAWIAEEIDPEDMAKTMGLYIAGTAFGGMAGRVGMGMLTELLSWQMALGLLGIVGLLCAVGFVVLLPASRHLSSQKGLNLYFHISMWIKHLKNKQLLRLYGIGFLITSIFVTLFNFITFRLADAPYALTQVQISLIFLSYGFGILSSSVAGSLLNRWGKKTIMLSGLIIMFLGMMLTLVNSLFGIVVGITFITTGFFVAHAVTSSEVGVTAQQATGYATSLYLLFYYMGSSIVGSVGGWFWQYGGWSALVMLTVCLISIAVILSCYSRQSEHA